MYFFFLKRLDSYIELVTSSLKYAFINLTEGKINVSLGKDIPTNSWVLVVSDNGKGMPMESEKRKDSLGLKLVSILTKQIAGDLKVKIENGSCFSIIFNQI